MIYTGEKKRVIIYMIMIYTWAPSKELIAEERNHMNLNHQQ